MDINLALQAIAQVGFPIVTAGFCMWYVREQNKDARAEREQMNKELGEKIEALNDNITKLIALETAAHYNEQNRKVASINDYGD